MAQVLRRCVINPYMISKWVRDPLDVPPPEMAVDDVSADTSCFISVEIIDLLMNIGPSAMIDPDQQKV